MDIIGTSDLQADDWQLQCELDNCAVVAEMSIINQFGYDLDQNEACYISASNGWYQPGMGTSPDCIGNMMDMYNIPNHTCENATIQDLAQELQAGHGVIVGVNSSELWDSGPLADLKHFLCELCGLDTSEFNPANHAVVVTGIDISDPDNPMVIINDSGDPHGASAHYPLDKFMDAWENSNFYYTATDGSIPSTPSGGYDVGIFANWFTAGVVAGASMAITGDVITSLDVGLTVGQVVEDYFNGNPELINFI